MTKKISTEDLQILYATHGTAKAVAEHINANYDTYKFGISERTVQHRLANKTIDVIYKKEETKVDTKPIAGGVVHAPDKVRRQLPGKRFVFTSAQNNTHVHEDFLASLLVFCQARGATLHVSQFAYNKAGFQNNTKESDDLWYDPRITEYTLNESVGVSKGLVFSGDLDILPTAVDPLSGFENYHQSASGIVPPLADWW